ncbi:transcription termination factor 1-like [Oppia nitens]|uniref:transcription termination factor 1-like n=1 Tax=Oppia nitens TaxID=1686743 RepID=UPI0023DBDC16|nr:transcription termination factor 1-like [Oppia nitens]
MNRKQYKRYGFVVTDRDYDKCNKRFKNNYNKFVNNNNNNSDNYEKRYTFVEKEVLNQSIDCHINDKQVMSDKSIQNDVTNTAFNTQSVNYCHNSNNININTNNCLISDSPLHRLIPYARNNLKEKKIIKENNIKVIKGKFSKHEINILKENWDKFCEDYNCDEDMKTRLLGFFALSQRYTKKERTDFREFMRSSQFLLRLANGLPNRTIYHIYFKARINFHSLKYLKDLSDDDVNSIRHYHSIYGAKWTKISEKFMSYPMSLKIYYKNNFNKNGEPFDKGKWSPDETKQLLDAMRRVLNTDDLKQHIYTKSIPFNQIVDEIDINRSYYQIHSHWLAKLRWSIAQWDQLEDSWTQKDTARLIYCLFKYDFTDELAIDWDEIKEKFANISSFNALMKNWRLIKQTVPSFESKSYKQIIDFLYNNFLPQFITNNDRGIDYLKEFELFFND